ncbi:hypothetical protein HF864_09245 [Lactobacillus sp. MRS-253-APC-2B]|uniref:hypothetical protein n=1 Tax=Lactobacillus sp. MRS-253-APC-2B TaxID=2725305 RepID=UPI00146A4C0C|nr:hypothetical protein [Lactobacillus sp. MRS-253-APC-2B]NME34934.1 hypothetical protein [Lactobacillus sp. MRS-253-APC-2B]
MNDIVTTTALKLRECSTLIPVELDDCVVLVDLSLLDMDALGCGLCNSQKDKLLQAYRPDMRAVDWWLNGSQTNRKLKCKTTDRIKAFNRDLDVFSPSGKALKLNAKGTGLHQYLGFNIRTFGFTRTAYLHNLIGAETIARVHKSEWKRWAKDAFNADYMTFTGYTMHHILSQQTATKNGNTPMNLILLDDKLHDTTRIHYNRLKRRIIDGDVDLNNKTVILPKN